MISGVLRILLALALALGAVALVGAEVEAPTVTEVLKKDAPDEASRKPAVLRPAEKYGRQTPYSTVLNYFKAARKGDWQAAARYLDLRNLPKGMSKADGPALAHKLKVVLDRALWVDMDLLSQEPLGHLDDGLPSYRDLVGQIRAGSRVFDILLQRVPGDKKGSHVWKFSNATVRQIPELYELFGYDPVGEWLSNYLPATSFLGLEAWQWVTLLAITLAAALVSLPVLRFLGWLIRRRQGPVVAQVVRFINGPVHFFVVVVLVRSYFDVIHPSLTAQSIFEAGTLLMISTAWILVGGVNLFRHYLEQRFRRRGQEQAVVLLKPLFVSVNLLIFIALLLIWLDNLGISVTTVIAGLGIGGLAVALATQKTLEDFIGALTLYLSAPVRIGDYCRFGDHEGTVEEIGLRATHIRTLDDTLISVPNSVFSGMQLENFSRRRRYRFRHLLRLDLGTDADRLRQTISGVRELLEADDRVLPRPLRVYLVKIGEYSLDVEIHCYIATAVLDEFKAISEELLFGIMETVERAGARLALPAAIEYQAVLGDRPAHDAS